jgi:hypothetical protein
MDNCINVNRPAFHESIAVSHDNVINIKCSTRIVGIANSLVTNTLANLWNWTTSDNMPLQSIIAIGSCFNDATNNYLINYWTIKMRLYSFLMNNAFQLRRILIVVTFSADSRNISCLFFTWKLFMAKNCRKTASSTSWGSLNFKSLRRNQKWLKSDCTTISHGLAVENVRH